MNRRAFLKAVPLGLATAAGVRYSWLSASPLGSLRHWLDLSLRSAPPPRLFDPLSDEGAVSKHADLDKVRRFDESYADDFRLLDGQLDSLHAAAARFGRLQSLVGHGNFNLLSFDKMLAFSRSFPDVGAFPAAELDFLEELFFADATRYGFFGEKVVQEMTARIPDRAVVKVAGSGHYLLKGEPLEKFRRIRRDVGEGITLTSGVRSLVKQYHLFLTKAVETGGNLSRASRSLAPPGYSFHARGDFDLGKAGFGLNNFTEEFCQTDEYRKLIDLGYVSIRYTPENPFGVRHEPWHIKIA